MNKTTQCFALLLLAVLVSYIDAKSSKSPIEKVLQKLPKFFKERDPYKKEEYVFTVEDKNVTFHGIEVKGLGEVKNGLTYDKERHVVNGDLTVAELYVSVDKIEQPNSIEAVVDLKVSVKDVTLAVTGIYNEDANQIEELKLNLNIQKEKIIKVKEVNGVFIPDEPVINEEHAYYLMGYFLVLEKEITDKVNTYINEALKKKKHHHSN